MPVAHVALTAEQTELVAVVARAVADRSGDDRAAGDGALGRHLASMGLVGLRVPERLGGAGAGAVEVALVVEQLAAGLAGAGYLGAVLATEVLLGGGAAGDGTPAALVVAEIGAGRAAGVVLDPQLAHLAPVGGDRAVAVDAAEGALVVGLEPDGTVATARAGARLDAADLTRALRRVEPRPAAVPPSAAVPPGAVPPGAAGALDPPAAARWQALALALTCADMVGAMTGALSGAVAHARQRRQFGRPVGSFQAVQHLCADQLVSIEAARSVTWHAAWAVDALEPDDALLAARVAKAWCADVGREVCEAAVQVWGGLGMTWECDAHRYLRRVLLDRRLFGDERAQLAAVADRHVGPVGAGRDGATVPG
jgi:alkylation response protein AidB-like acyl-CoA dehydrogenase